MKTYLFKRNTSSELEIMSKRKPNAIELLATFNMNTCELNYDISKVALHTVDRANPVNSFTSYKIGFYVYDNGKHKDLAKTDMTKIGKFIRREFRGTYMDNCDDSNIISSYVILNIDDESKINDYKKLFLDEIYNFKNRLTYEYNRKIEALNGILGE